MKQTVSKLMMVFGFFCLLISLYFTYQRYSPVRLSFQNIPSSVKHSAKEIPTEIFIKNLHLDLPIIQSKISNGKWEATTKGVSFLNSSPIPGEKGNSILYGHNFPNLLGNLQQVKPGDEVQIVMNDKSVRSFIVEYTSIVTPDQTHILSQTLDKRITLYTCTGFLDSKRFVVTAILKS